MLKIKGSRFGDLKVEAVWYEDVLNGKTWLCSCICGNEMKITEDRLLSGVVKHCENSIHGVHEIPEWYLISIMRGAKDRNRSFNVSAEYLWQVLLTQDRKCRFTGEILILSEEQEKHTASLDRIDSTVGYEVGNIQWVHKTINMMKGRQQDRKFIEWCTKVAEHNKPKLLANLLMLETEG